MWQLAETPYQVQLEARNRARGKRCYGFWLEQGLGKTAVTLDEIIELYMADEIVGAIIAMPNNLLENWKDEAKAMGFPGDVYSWQHDDLRKINFKRLWVVVINYEATITSKGEKFYDEMIQRFGRKLYLAVDEGSKIKGPTAKRTLNLIRFSVQSGGWVRDLTGTPMTQGPQDLWGQLKFMRATNLRFYAFRNRYCKMGGYMGRQIVGVQDDKVEELQRLVDRNAFVAKKRDWAKHLPEKLPPIIRGNPMSKEQKRLYEEMQEDFYTEIGGHEIEASMAITQLLRLQQITSGFVGAVDGDVVPIFDDPLKIPKIQSLLDTLEETEGKTIIFCKYRKSVEIVTKVLRGLGRQPVHVVGKQGRPIDLEYVDTKQARDVFNNRPECRDIVAQIDTGGIGLTLLGQPGPDRCATTIFFENSFSLEARLQAEDRNHRHGQDTPVTYVDFVASPIEKRIIDALHRKLDLSLIITDPDFWSFR